jgi:hypothetical protein
MLDYLVGVALIIAPWLLGFGDEGGAATWLPVALGTAAIVYSLLTDYELGLVKITPMPVHLRLDMASGALLAVSPWLFGFADRVWVPHVVFGLIEIVAPQLTQTTPMRQAGAGRRSPL